MKRKRLILFMCEIAVFAAMALVFDFLIGLTPGFVWLDGGHISIAMIPIFIVGYKYGPRGGFLCAFLVGTIQLFWAKGMISFVQVLLDYVIAYTVLGVASIFYKQVSYRYNKDNMTRRVCFVIISILLACLIRTIPSTISGMVYYSVPFWGSFVYNVTYIGFSGIISIPIVVILLKALKNFQ